MTYTKRYMSPIGVILLAADDAGLTGLWFEGSKYFAAELAQLEGMQEQGLVRVGPEGIEVTATGWFFVRGIAMVFDRYLQADRNRARFSRII